MIFKNDLLKKRDFEKMLKSVNEETENKYKKEISTELKERFKTWCGNNFEFKKSVSGLNYAVSKKDKTNDDFIMMYVDLIIVSSLINKEYE